MTSPTEVTPAPLMLRPSQVVKRYSLPRDRLYKAIVGQELPAYNVGSPKRAAYLVADADVKTWLETLRLGKA